MKAVFSTIVGCNSKEASDESFGVFKFEAVIRRTPQTKAVFDCNSQDASHENCAFDVLSKLGFLEAVFLMYCESCVFDVLAVCYSTEASAAIRRSSQVKAMCLTFARS